MAPPRGKRRTPQHHLTLTLERMPDDTFTASLKMASGRTKKKELDIVDWAGFLMTIKQQFSEAEMRAEENEA